VGEVVGGELGGQRAPREAEAGADHRHRRQRPAEHPQQVRQHARGPQPDEHERQGEPVRVHRAEARGGDGGDGDGGDDRDHRDVLTPAGVLAEHPLRDEQQHQQPHRERGLHDDQRGQQQRDHLQRPAEDRQPGAEQPAGAHDQVAHQPQAQVLVAGGLPGVHRLERDP